MLMKKNLVLAWIKISDSTQLLLAIENENKLLELERCSDAINEMNNARRGKQTTLSLILAEPTSTLWKKH